MDLYLKKKDHYSPCFSYIASTIDKYGKILVIFDSKFCDNESQITSIVAL